MIYHEPTHHTDDAKHDYDAYIERFRLADDEAASRQRSLKPKRKPKKSRDEILETIAETAGLEAGFKTTYQPARFETGWLFSSLQVFYDQGLIVDVLAQVKGGKEASVYLCKADPETGMDLVAAKVYRPRQFRNLRNDAMYREGREILGGDGNIIKRRDSREMRAMKNKTEFGSELLHGSWLMHEYSTIQRLHTLGAAVPKPIFTGPNAILMDYIGDAKMAAPTLQSTALAPHEVQPLFQEAMRNIELMLKHELIHGDLSAFNILYWQGKITLIDFPQVTPAFANRNAYNILRRDIQRVCEYFMRYGLRTQPGALADKLWWQYVGVEPGKKMSDEPA